MYCVEVLHKYFGITSNLASKLFLSLVQIKNLKHMFMSGVF